MYREKWTYYCVAYNILRERLCSESSFVSFLACLHTISAFCEVLCTCDVVGSTADRAFSLKSFPHWKPADSYTSIYFSCDVLNEHPRHIPVGLKALENASELRRTTYTKREHVEFVSPNTELITEHFWLPRSKFAVQAVPANLRRTYIVSTLYFRVCIERKREMSADRGSLLRAHFDNGVVHVNDACIGPNYAIRDPL